MELPGEVRYERTLSKAAWQVGGEEQEPEGDRVSLKRPESF